MDGIYVIGVFDMLHSGHYNLLYRSKALAPESPLIVGVCADSLVKQTKGRNPIVKDAERVRQISLLDIVDDAFLYNDIDQTSILIEKRPSILVIPPDYGYCAAHAETLRSAAMLNIRVVRLERTMDISTTSLRMSDLSSSNLGCDYHDTITYNPAFFRFLLREWKHGKKYIISGDTNVQDIAAGLTELGITPDMYDEILVTPYPTYSPDERSHYDIVKELKLKHVLTKNIAVYFDDNPIYAEYIRNYATVFYTSLSDAYINAFNTTPKHKNINFQRHINAHIQQASESWLATRPDLTDISDTNLLVAQQFWKNQIVYPEYGNIKQRRYHEVTYFLKKLGFSPINTLVDLGCGDGSFVRCVDTLLEINRVHCFDLSEPLMKAIPTSSRISAQVFDCSDPRYFQLLPAADVLMFGGVINFIFDDAVAIRLLQHFNAAHIFIRAVCTLGPQDELVNTYSERLKSQYASYYRTVECTLRLITAAGLIVKEHVRIYPDEIESAFNTRQYMFYVTRN